MSTVLWFVVVLAGIIGLGLISWGVHGLSDLRATVRANESRVADQEKKNQQAIRIRWP